MKPLRDFQKVRRVVGWLRRNRPAQARASHLQALDYLHAGCGPQITPGFINLDYRWVPRVDVVWDLTRALPFGRETPAHAINRVFYSGHDQMKHNRWRSDGHHFMHDFHSLAGYLAQAAFGHITSAAYRQGGDSRLLIDRADREWESLYIEASKPDRARTA